MGVSPNRRVHQMHVIFIIIVLIIVIRENAKKGTL